MPNYAIEAGVAPGTVADYFIRLANEVGSSMTNLRLQKLVYYAQAWSLALRNKALFAEDFEAWVHGPVLRSLWDEHKARRWLSIDKNVEHVDLPQNVRDFLSEVVQVYFSLDAYELERMTHAEAPWQIARGDLPPHANCENIITKDSMTEFYSGRATQQN